MEQLFIIKKQQRILFRGHPQKNAEYFGWYHITCRHFKESSTCPYDFGKPLMWQFDGGYVDLDDNGSPTGWNYYVTDHLGSTRKVVGSNDSIKEAINYYPFGSEMRMQDPAQMTNEFEHPYRFTGKELDRLNGLNMYDFGARLFDVAGVPMWTSVDPLAEKYYSFTPYSYCAGNPVNKFDPDGREDYEINKDGYIKNVTSVVDKVKKFFGLGNKDDKIFMEGEKAPLVTLPEGSVTNVKDGTDYSKFEIANAKDAEKTFQKVIGKSNVEWAHVRHEGKDGSGSSLIINNHSDTDVSKSADFAREYQKNGESVTLFEHSHPLEKMYKMNGLPNLPVSYPPSKDDIKTASHYPNTVFKVYDVYNRKVYNYGKKK